MFKAGKISQEFFTPDIPSQWFAKMKRKDEFVDEMFFTFAAIKLKRDLIFLYVHENPESDIHWIKGKVLLSDIPNTDNCPIFIGKWSELRESLRESFNSSNLFRIL